MLVEKKQAQKEAKLLTEKLNKLLEQHKELLEENKKVKQTALQISQRLEETNLSNAILLYKNQALGSDSLNERQKNKIVEAVSKAGSVDEAKMIFETLCNAVGSFDNRGPQSLSEAVETRGSLSLKSRQENNSNPNPLKNRWQKIAGIKK
jgi:Na+/phosphate symporter